jgi:hypothetical protein
MFDDLRNDSNQAAFLEDQPAPAAVSTGGRPAKKAKKKSTKILGMTAVQRFVLATLLFLVVCILGVAVLVLTGKVALM